MSRANGEIRLRPNKKQLMFITARQRYIGYGGARGGGKSWAVRVKAMLLARRYPGIRMLIVRRTYAELQLNHTRPLQTLLRGQADYVERDKEFRFANGSSLMLGFCDAQSDVLRYQGQEFDVIFLDEATQLTEYQFQTFKGCLRGVNDFPKRIYVTCNPGGVGHAWVKRLFIDRDFRPGEDPDDYVFIPAGVRDNDALMASDPGYVENLKSLPYALRMAWLEGRWDVFAGQFFTEWNESVHVTEPFDVPDWWRFYVTMDYGMDMLAAYLIGVDPAGTAWVMREVYDGRDLGEGHDGLIISRAAQKVKTLAAGRRITAYLAPPDLWNRRQETGRSAADIFAEHGLRLTMTSNDRFDGWMAMRERLKVVTDERGQPSAGLRIFRCCPNLIRTIPLLTYDADDPNDAADTPHEITHGPDAIRGFCVYRTGAAKRPAVRRAWTGDMWQDYRAADPDTRRYLLERWGEPANDPGKMG